MMGKVAVLMVLLGIVCILCGNATASGSRRGTTRRRASSAKHSGGGGTPPPPPPAPEDPEPTTSVRRRIKKGSRLPRIVQEFREFSTDKSLEEDGLYAELVDDDQNHWLASFTGPRDTAYEGGRFWVEISVPSDYPNRPPQVYFRTTIYHPNISGSSICLDILKGPPAWTPSHNIAGVLRSLRLLLEMPNADDPLNGDAGREYRNYPSSFRQTAKDYTKRYAGPNNKPYIR